MEKTAKVFVAGSTGLVGAAIERKLRESGYANILTRPHGGLDLTRQEDTERFLEAEKPDYVFLAAAKVGGILANNTYRAEFIYDNLMIAANVINSAFKAGVKKLLNLGSSCIYPKFAPQPMKEEYLLTGELESTNEPYAIAKIAAIKLCRYYNEQYDTNYISVMPTNLYGPNDNFHLLNSHVLPALIRKFHLAVLMRNGEMARIRGDIKRRDNISMDDKSDEDVKEYLASFMVTEDSVGVWGTGKPYREFLYIDDLAEACVYLMEKYDFKDMGEFVNIGTGRDVTILGLAKTIKDIIGFDGDLVFDASKPDGTPRKLLDVSRLRALGWEAKTSLAEGIQKTYEFYRAS